MQDYRFASWRAAVAFVSPRGAALELFVEVAVLLTLQRPGYPFRWM
jgi:hypothetical protein